LTWDAGGLYSARLATLGHACRGIDFAPASIEYAVKHALEACSYTLGDLRTTDYGSGYDLAMLIFGEFNVFKSDDARLILQKTFEALKPGGKLLLEVLTIDALYESGNQPATWYTAENELFADVPHLCLMESFWDDEQHVTTERYYIVDLTSGDVTRYASSSQAYEREQFVAMGRQAGFREVVFHPSLTGSASAPDGMFVVVMTK
jgi:SAM-dependent methyltransferase